MLMYIPTSQTATLGFPNDGRRVAGGGVKMLAYEGIREKFGGNPCDSRRPKEELEKVAEPRWKGLGCRV